LENLKQIPIFCLIIPIAPNGEENNTEKKRKNRSYAAIFTCTTTAMRFSMHPTRHPSREGGGAGKEQYSQLIAIIGLLKRK